MANSDNVYATVQPIQANVSEWVNDQEKMDFAYRDEQRKIAALDETKKAKEQAKKDALRKSVFGDIPKNYDTGSASLNEFQAKIIQKAVNRKGEIYKELSKPNLSDDDRIKLEIENQNLENLPENLQIATKNFSGVIGDYRKGVADGSYFRNPDFESKVLNGFENYVGGLDNGLPVVGFVDRDGDGVMDVLPYESLAQSYGPDNSNLPWQFQKQVDLDKLAVSTGEKLGKVEKTTDGNFIKHTIKGPDLKSLNTLTDNILQNPDGSPTDAALSELKKRGLPANEANLAKVKQIFKDRVLAYADRADNTDVDYAGMNAAQREARQARKENEDKPEIGTPVPASEQAWGRQYKNLNTKDKLSVPVAKGEVKIPSLRIKTGKDKKTGKAKHEYVTDAIVENYTYNKDGKLVVDVSYPGEKVSVKDKETGTTVSSAPKLKRQTVVTPETETRIAKELGMTVEQLKASANNPDAEKETAAERAIRIANGG